jgi:hypothetical protein
MADVTPHPHLLDLGRRLHEEGKLPEEPADADAAAHAIADLPDQPDEMLIRGFVGAQTEHGGKNWRLVYLDSVLRTWLLVPENEITAFERVDDPEAPSGQRDMVWINRGAQMVRGSGFGPIARRFLVGELTLAADFAPETSGGTCSTACEPTCMPTTIAPRCYQTRH